MPQSGPSIQIDDWLWLRDPVARRVLRQVVCSLEGGATELRILTELRRDHAAGRSSLLLSQAQCVLRGRRKFQRADELMFTEQGLAQATDERIAGYKAARLGRGRVIDLCCGIGGDLMAFAQRGPTVGVDHDPVTAICAAHNVEITAGAETTVLTIEAEKFEWDRNDVVHIDPDRRPEQRRTVDLRYFSPNLDVLDHILGRDSATVIKIAPATPVPDSWLSVAEVEWIGHRGECKQQIVWTRNLARYPGRRVATVVSTRDGHRESLIQDDACSVTVETMPPRVYVWEPNAAVLAARLVPELANRLGGTRLSPGGDLLSSEEPQQTLLASCFQVLEILPLRRSTIEDYLRGARGRIVESKKRGLPGVELQKFVQFPAYGDNAMTLLLSRVMSEPRAILCCRWEQTSAE